jgi:protoporphyrinogen oxidase
VLQFTPLPLLDRLRAGLVGAYLTLTRNWHRLERVTADEWMRNYGGEQAYEILWRPLLVSKFGEEHYREVNMAWMWARLYKRTAGLGYFVGGFQAFADLLAEHASSHGAEIRMSAGVHAIEPRASRGLHLETRDGPAEHEAVIATCSPREMLRIAPALSGAYAEQLRGLKSLGAVVLVLALKHPLTEDHYWINLPKGADIPFMGLVEHTNYVSPEHYGGDHLVYCGDYLPAGHPYFGYSKEQLLQDYLPGLTRINPSFARGWIRASWKFTEAYAQPVPTVNHSANIPALRTSIAGLWLGNMSQVYPWDRGTNYAIELGRQLAQEVVA